MSEKLITQNLMMVEHAANDPRSALAMLQGKGDGREQSWLDFEKVHSEIIDQEIIMALFSHEARYGRIKLTGHSPSKQLLKGMMGLIGLAIIIF